MEIKAWETAVAATVTDVGVRVLGAIVLWVVGRWLVGLAVRLVSAGLIRKHVDETVMTYVRSALTGLLNIVLIVSILGSFGVQTSSFAAVLAAVGFAIGTAWSGLLSHFASGVFLVVLRPFKVGDFITAGGVTGSVLEIGPFTTKITSPDNVLSIVGNSKIFSDNIQNYTAHPYRRVELTAQLNPQVNVSEAVSALKARLAAIPNVLTDPAPVVEILEFNSFGPLLAVRPFCSNTNYWQVYFDTNRTILENATEKGYPVPESHVAMRNKA